MKTILETFRIGESMTVKRGLFRVTSQIFAVSLLFITASLSLAATPDSELHHLIEDRLTEPDILQDTQIAVHVENSMVVLTGKVKLLQQKLVADRVAWTTSGVYEVENEIEIRPDASYSDSAISKMISVIIERDPRYLTAVVNLTVRDGKVYLKGNFLKFSDPVHLKHKIARIPGVTDIEISSTFIAQRPTKIPPRV
jgi:osmotically-inducible protein OsmY